MSPARVKVVIIEPRALVREGLVRLIEGLSYDVICTVDSVSDICGPKFIEDEQKLVLLSGRASPCMRSAVKELRRMWSDSKIIVLCEENSSIDFREDTTSELDGCAPLFVPKDVLVKLIDLIVRGDTRVLVLPKRCGSYVRPSALEDDSITGLQSSSDSCRQIIIGENDGHAAVQHGGDDASLGTGRRASRMRLSDREMQILDSLVKGNSNKLIARSCEITEATVKVHMKSILRKIQVGNRTQAAIWALANGYSTEDVTGRLMQAAEEE